jgi:hypothetical protein
MNTSPYSSEELAELRSRMQAALLDSTQPLPARLAEFRRLLRVSQDHSADTEAILRALEDSY